MKYSIKITDNDGTFSYLTIRGRSAWSLRVAKEHASEFFANSGFITTVEDQFGDVMKTYGENIPSVYA